MFQVMSSQVSVCFIDYGIKAFISFNNIKELKDMFRILPTQALHCSLHDVVPLAGHWTSFACMTFSSIVMQNMYTATIADRSDDGR